MTTKVFITGTGIISAIGNNYNEVLQSVKESRTGIAYSSSLNSIYRDEIPMGEIKLSDFELIMLAEPEAKRAYSRTALLGMIAAKEALKTAGIYDVNEFKTGLISSNTVGGMDKSELFYRQFLPDRRKGKLKNIVTHDCGESTQQIANYLQINYFHSTISTACSSSANAIMLGARLIKHGLIDRMVVGGTDALSVFTVNGFNSLLILDRKPCRPFDETRNGLNLGEGAGFIILESEKCVNLSKKNPLCELTGYGNACDAFHQTASSPDGNGAKRAIGKALKSANLLPSQIDYINVHGTATPNNDLSEGVAIQTIFGDKVPYFSSTKSLTGHTLGASGGIEAVLCVIAIKNKMIFPSLNFSAPMKELSITPVKELKENIQVKHVLSNSFGFGGNNSSLIFSAI
jgi:3-oxoacyl-(acyl-carrier-protein) synthase